jgi:urease accessory protein
MIKSDLCIINKTDLAPYVGASLDVMERDTLTTRGDKPFFFTNLKDEKGLTDVVNWIKSEAFLIGLEQ